MNVTRREEGQVLQVLGDRVTVKLPSSRSPHGMSIVDVVVPPGSGTPCVTHDQEEEVYFLVEGELLMHTPTEHHHLHPGDLVHLPPLTPHGYRNPGQQPARFLAWTIGGPMDQFFARIAQDVQELPRDLPRMQAAMDAFGVRRAA